MQLDIYLIKINFNKVLASRYNENVIKKETVINKTRKKLSRYLAGSDIVPLSNQEWSFVRRPLTTTRTVVSEIVLVLLLPAFISTTVLND